MRSQSGREVAHRTGKQWRSSAWGLQWVAPVLHDPGGSPEGGGAAAGSGLCPSPAADECGGSADACGRSAAADDCGGGAGAGAGAVVGVLRVPAAAADKAWRPALWPSRRRLPWRGRGACGIWDEDRWDVGYGLERFGIWDGGMEGYGMEEERCLWDEEGAAIENVEQ